jgi:predicted alpha/beta hydrolase family esterase
MKTAILLHGTGGNDKDYFWFADTKKHLEANGYEVWGPLLPHTEKPELVESNDFLEKNLPPIDQETIIIGHSSACPLILYFLQNFDVMVKQVVLVSGFYKSLDDAGDSGRMLPASFDWANIKNKGREFILINSDNDPWGCNDYQARPVAVALEATMILASGQGHMGSTSHNQPYKEFKLLNRLLT